MKDIDKDELLEDYLSRYPQKREIAEEIGIHWVTLSKFINGHHVGDATLIKIHYFLKSNFIKDLDKIRPNPVTAAS